MSKSPVVSWIEKNLDIKLDPWQKRLVQQVLAARRAPTTTHPRRTR